MRPMSQQGDKRLGLLCGMEAMDTITSFSRLHT